MKKRAFLLVALAILAGVIGVVSLLCSTVNTGSPVVWINQSHSWLRGFYVADDTAKIKCCLSIENQSDHDASIMLVGYFEADHNAGLLKESQLLGCAEEYPKSTIFTVPPGGACFNVDFIGTYGGTPEKQNRLIPEIQLIVVQEALVEKEKTQEATRSAALFEETFTFEGNTAEVVVAVSMLPDSSETVGVSAYTGEGGLFDADTRTQILSACRPMPIDSTAKLIAYLKTVYPLLTESGYVPEDYAPYEIQVYTNDVMCIQFCKADRPDPEKFIDQTEIYVSLENGIILSAAKLTLAEDQT